MNLTWHIVRKDLVRLRWILVLWVALVVAYLVLAKIQASLDAEGAVPFYWFTWIFGRIFMPALNLGLMMGLQGDDSVCDSDAFWITRPISGLRLLSAKSVLLGLFWITPAVVMAPWWLSQGYGVMQFAAAAGQVVVAQAFFSLLVMPLVLLSPNTSRYVMHLVLAAAVVGVLALIGAWTGIGGTTGRPAGVLESRGWVLVALGLAATVSVALIQFRRRRTSRSVVVLGAALVAGVAVLGGWRWDLTPGATDSGKTPAAQVLNFQVKALGYQPGNLVSGTGEPVVVADLAPDGLPAAAVPQVTSVAHRWVWPDDSVALPAPPPDADGLVRASLALARVAGVDQGLKLVIPPPAGPASDRQRREPPRYEATIAGELEYLTLAAEMPARPDAKSVRHGIVARVEFFAFTDPRGLVIPLSESEPLPSHGRWDLLFGPHPQPAGQEFYFLLNRIDGRSLVAQAARTGDPLKVAGVVCFRTSLLFSPAEIRRAGIPASDLPAWVDQAVLVKVTAHAAGPFRGTVVVPRFEPVPARANP